MANPGPASSTTTMINQPNVSPDGYEIGKTAASLIGFYGATPIVQRTSANQAAVVTTAPTSTTPFGYTTSAQAAAIVTLVNELRAAMVAAGLIKGA